MRRLVSGVLMVATLSLVAALPVAAGKTSGPSAAMTNPGSCATIAYSWAGFRKADKATIKVHHNGIYMAEASLQPVSDSGIYLIPAALSDQLVAGDNYTFLGLLTDSAGRTIQPSGAAWWGRC